MDLSTISEEIIKPSLPLSNFKPFKLSFLDQLGGRNYSPFIFFYLMNDSYLKTDISSELRRSLSKTLDEFYPLSGKIQPDNVYINNFDEGVPFIETRVKGQLLDFLQNPQLELINEFLPIECFCVLSGSSLPQIAIQANIFDCGGLALGISLSHKLIDGATLGSFLKCWAANTSGSVEKVIQPNLFEGSSMFPPLEHLPNNEVEVPFENTVFTKGKLRVMRFLFDANAIATLQAKSKSNHVEHPSRVLTLSAFIWKSKMAAYKKAYNVDMPSILMQAKNLRAITKPQMSENAIGNLVWNPGARFEKDMELSGLVKLIKEALDNVNADFFKGGPMKIFERLNFLASKKNLDVLFCSNWTTFGYEDIDFGWGKPAWIGLLGKTSSTNFSCSNIAILKNAPGRKSAIEAWLILDEKIMNFLEKDPEFLAFASPNPPIINVKYSKL